MASSRIAMVRVRPGTRTMIAATVISTVSPWRMASVEVAMIEAVKAATISPRATRFGDRPRSRSTRPTPRAASPAPMTVPLEPPASRLTPRPVTQKATSTQPALHRAGRAKIASSLRIAVSVSTSSATSSSTTSFTSRNRSSEGGRGWVRTIRTLCRSSGPRPMVSPVGTAKIEVSTSNLRPRIAMVSSIRYEGAPPSWSATATRTRSRCSGRSG